MLDSWRFTSRHTVCAIHSAVSIIKKHGRTMFPHIKLSKRTRIRSLVAVDFLLEIALSCDEELTKQICHHNCRSLTCHGEGIQREQLRSAR